jgi:hypothetical protein
MSRLLFGVGIKMIWICEGGGEVMVMEEDMILVQQPTNIVINNTPHYSNKIGRKCLQRSVSLITPAPCPLSSWIWVQSNHHVVSWETKHRLWTATLQSTNHVLGAFYSSVFLDLTHDNTVQAVASAAERLCVKRRFEWLSNCYVVIMDLEFQFGASNWDCSGKFSWAFLRLWLIVVVYSLLFADSVFFIFFSHCCSS